MALTVDPLLSGEVMIDAELRFDCCDEHDSMVVDIETTPEYLPQLKWKALFRVPDHGADMLDRASVAVLRCTTATALILPDGRRVELDQLEPIVGR